MGPLHFLPSPLGLALAAAAVVLGAPLFSDGLRALRLRRHLLAVREAGLEDSTHGFTHVRGLVALESPLFSPLGGEPCAGFQLEIAGEGHPVRRHVAVRRAFRLVDRGTSARVSGDAARWDLETTATRRIAPDEPMSEGLTALLAGVPEAEWLRRAGVPLVLTERALLAGRECHVVGFARSTAAIDYATPEVMMRTGTDAGEFITDDLLAAVAASAKPARVPRVEPAVTLSTGEHLDFLLVSDRAPTPAQLRVPSWRAIGVLLGPALTLAGMFYLAAAADFVRAAGRF